MTMPTRLNTLVILGGGTAGWMAAAGLARFLESQPVRIRLVESQSLGTVGVGEATVPVIRDFNRFLGIDEAEFVSETAGSFKLGIEFRDWLKPGSRYFHGFGDFGAPVDGVAAHHYWRRLSAEGDAESLMAYSFPAQAAWHNRFAPPPNDERLAAVAAFDYAYHFDATRYAELLSRYAQQRGVERIEGRVDDVERSEDSGGITALRLDTGERIPGDFFIDCSGFNSRILYQSLGVPYRDWRHWLPCDRALAVSTARRDPLTPYTRATARRAGWQWRIPLQHRVGNGYVYASEFAGNEEAEALLLQHLESEPLTEWRRLSFTTGHRESFWQGNCLALGLAAGFLEPLESTSIQLIQTGLMRFLELFPARGVDPVVAREYNRVTANEYARLRDFLILHYCTSLREDSPFWRQARTQTPPESLAHKLEVFRATGRVPMLTEESYSEASWVSILVGQGVLPRSGDPRAAFLPAGRIDEFMRQRRERIQQVVERMPEHAHFVARTCPARS